MTVLFSNTHSKHRFGWYSSVKKIQFKFEAMAGSFTWKRWILAAVLVAALPCVAPYNYNTCSGGLFAKTCTARYSSHCCKSGTYLSATCCQNSCSKPGSFGRSSTTTCYFRSDSMCCSTKSLGSESCCNYAEYARTSTSMSVRAQNERSAYGSCTGVPDSTEYCLNSLSIACCSSVYYSSATCCRPSTCLAALYVHPITIPFPQICHGSSTYCCSASKAKSCCDSDAYQRQESSGTVVGAIVGGVIGGIILLVIIIVVPVAVVCCRASGTRETGNANTTVVAVTAASNQIQQPVAYYQPAPYGYSQPPPYGNQLPVNNNQQWNQSSAPQYLPQPPPVPTPIEQSLPEHQQA